MRLLKLKALFSAHHLPFPVLFPFPPSPSLCPSPPLHHNDAAGRLRDFHALLRDRNERRNFILIFPLQFCYFGIASKLYLSVYLLISNKYMRCCVCFGVVFFAAACVFPHRCGCPAHLTAVHHSYNSCARRLNTAVDLSRTHYSGRISSSSRYRHQASSRFIFSTLSNAFLMPRLCFTVPFLSISLSYSSSLSCTLPLSL